jgi:hypothetical protein
MVVVLHSGLGCGSQVVVDGQDVDLRSFPFRSCKIGGCLAKGWVIERSSDPDESIASESRIQQVYFYRFMKEM